nr:putative integron gene cassette protein [uncultured bacterium]
MPGRTRMLRLATDADVHGDIIRGLRRRSPGIDLVRIQDALPEGTPDPNVLLWAAAQKRTLITNDRNTMVAFAYERVAAGEKVPGLIVTTNDQSIGSAIEDILLIAECMPEEEIRDQVVVYLPLRD